MRDRPAERALAPGALTSTCRVLGRSYDAAVVSGGFIGFALGATPSVAPSHKDVCAQAEAERKAEAQRPRE
jgi:sodium--glutamate symport carrier gltS